MNDQILPFQIDASNLRGRVVRLGPALDLILGKHAYPEPVARFLAETIALAALLAGMLKYDGIFTLQTKGDGPVRLMVADVTSSGDIRAYAQFDAEALAKAGDDVAIAPAPALLGRGHIAFSVDQGPDTERYQGIVGLKGKTLADCVQHYFRQSEQIDTGITVAVDHPADGTWRAGGIMLQKLPQAADVVPASDQADGWRRAMLLLSTVKTDELTSGTLASSELLLRLFHEDGVRAWAPQPLRFACRCSRERVSDMLAKLPRAEVEHLRVDGAVEVTCQFCSSAYRFNDAELARVYGG